MFWKDGYVLLNEKAGGCGALSWEFPKRRWLLRRVFKIGAYGSSPRVLLRLLPLEIGAHRDGS